MEIFLTLHRTLVQSQVKRHLSTMVNCAHFRLIPRLFASLLLTFPALWILVFLDMEELQSSRGDLIVRLFIWYDVSDSETGFQNRFICRGLGRRVRLSIPEGCCSRNCFRVLRIYSLLGEMQIPPLVIVDVVKVTSQFLDCYRCWFLLCAIRLEFANKISVLVKVVDDGVVREALNLLVHT